MSLIDEVRVVLCSECWGAPVVFERESDAEVVLRVDAEPIQESGRWTREIAAALMAAGLSVTRSRRYVSVMRPEDRTTPQRIPDTMLRRPERCASCPHPPHTGMCRNGGTAYACPCHRLHRRVRPCRDPNADRRRRIDVSAQLRERRGAPTACDPNCRSTTGEDHVTWGKREDRIHADDGGPWCDKAWHLSGEPVKATAYRRCAICGVEYARCAACNRGGSAVDVSMRAHLYLHRVRAATREGER